MIGHVTTKMAPDGLTAEVLGTERKSETINSLTKKIPNL